MYFISKQLGAPKLPTIRSQGAPPRFRLSGAEGFPERVFLTWDSFVSFWVFFYFIININTYFKYLENRSHLAPTFSSPMWSPYCASFSSSVLLIVPPLLHSQCLTGAATCGHFKANWWVNSRELPCSSLLEDKGLLLSKFSLAMALFRTRLFHLIYFHLS